MLLSFSVDYMRPMIVEGYRQYSGGLVTARVKRQTIRALGPRNKRLLQIADPSREMALHLWWKSRTTNRKLIGAVTAWTIEPVRIWNNRGMLNVAVSNSALAWPKFDNFIHADGFDGIPDFGKYFVPNPGDVFEGVLFKW